jgi:hypothetical protein
MHEQAGNARPDLIDAAIPENIRDARRISGHWRRTCGKANGSMKTMANT